MTTTKLVKVNHEDVLCRVVPMGEVQVGDVIVTPEAKANTTSMRYRHPYHPGRLDRVLELRVMKQQVTARCETEMGSYEHFTNETHLARVNVLVKVVSE